SEMNKKTSEDLVVSTRMDLSFKDDLTVTTAAGNLQGPWTVEGVLVRTNGTGPADIPLWVQIDNPSGGLITSPPITVSLAGVGYTEQPFSVVLNSSTLTSLPDGDHVVVAKINPFNEAGFEQEDTTNDMASGILTIFPIPDVYVDANALPTVPSVQSGEDVEWRVTMENTGDIAVSGFIQYSFDGLQVKRSLGPWCCQPPWVRTRRCLTASGSLPRAVGTPTSRIHLPAGACWSSQNSNSIGITLPLKWWTLKANPPPCRFVTVRPTPLPSG
ncbi:MAG: hypothetical protein ACPG8Q_05935, partial [Candidatus Poseidoniaceae archaeon]